MLRMFVRLAYRKRRERERDRNRRRRANTENVCESQSSGDTGCLRGSVWHHYQQRESGPAEILIHCPV